jgi:hypothetical protein
MELTMEEFLKYLVGYAGRLELDGFRVYAGNVFYTANSAYDALRIMGRFSWGDYGR